QIRSAARLNGGRDARLQVVAVDRLEVDLDSQCLLGLGQQLLAQKLIGSGNKVVPAEPVNGSGLRIGGGAGGWKDTGPCTRLRRQCTGTRCFQEFAASKKSHRFLRG